MLLHLVDLPLSPEVMHSNNWKDPSDGWRKAAAFDFPSLERLQSLEEADGAQHPQGIFIPRHVNMDVIASVA
jgi:hypothetical protein